MAKKPTPKKPHKPSTGRKRIITPETRNKIARALAAKLGPTSDWDNEEPTGRKTTGIDKTTGHKITTSKPRTLTKPKTPPNPNTIHNPNGTKAHGHRASNNYLNTHKITQEPQAQERLTERANTLKTPKQVDKYLTRLDQRITTANKDTGNPETNRQNQRLALKHLVEAQLLGLVDENGEQINETPTWTPPKTTPQPQKQPKQTRTTTKTKQPWHPKTHKTYTPEQQQQEHKNPGAPGGIIHTEAKNLTPLQLKRLAHHYGLTDENHINQLGVNAGNTKFRKTETFNTTYDTWLLTKLGDKLDAKTPEELNTKLRELNGGKDPHKTMISPIMFQTATPELRNLIEKDLGYLPSRRNMERENAGQPKPHPRAGLRISMKRIQAETDARDLAALRADQEKIKNETRTYYGIHIAPPPSTDDSELTQRRQWVEKTVTQLVDNGLTSRKLNITGVDKDGKATYAEERRAQQKELIAELLRRGDYDTVPSDRKVLMSGGIGGSGKGYVLSLRDDDTKYFTINSDDVKELMAEMGMVDTPEGMTPMEAAGLIHAESGDIAETVTQMALEDGKNVIFDITMTTSGSVTGRIKKAKAHGYDEFTGVYVDVPLEVSLKSAQERYIRGAQEYTDGVGYGGRYVPESAIMRAQVPGSDKTRNRQVFEGLTASKVFTATEIWDNNRQDENGNRLPAALIERTTTNGKEHHRPVRSRGSDDGRRETSTRQRAEGSGNQLGHDSGVRRPAGPGRSTDQDSSSRNAREDHDGTSKRNVQPRSNNIQLTKDEASQIIEARKRAQSAETTPAKSDDASLNRKAEKALSFDDAILDATTDPYTRDDNGLLVPEKGYKLDALNEKKGREKRQTIFNPQELLDIAAVNTNDAKQTKALTKLREEINTGKQLWIEEDGTLNTNTTADDDTRNYLRTIIDKIGMTPKTFTWDDGVPEGRVHHDKLIDRGWTKDFIWEHLNNVMRFSDAPQGINRSTYDLKEVEIAEAKDKKLAKAIERRAKLIPPADTPAVSENTWTRNTLKERGWTEAKIKLYLGEPDFWDSGWYQSTAKWHKDRALKAEEIDDTLRKRREAAEKKRKEELTGIVEGGKGYWRNINGEWYVTSKNIAVGQTVTVRKKNGEEKKVYIRKTKTVDGTTYGIPGTPPPVYEPPVYEKYEMSKETPEEKRERERQWAHSPITPNQLSYLEKLLYDHISSPHNFPHSDLPKMEDLPNFTRGDASRWIDRLLRNEDL